MRSKGYFITMEGGEGCGKTTHSKALKKHLEGRGYKVILTREPGGTPTGKAIRRILLSNSSRINAAAELLLFAADRFEHVQKIVAPALSEGSVVISDRYVDSTTAYQIGGRGLPEDMVKYINRVSSAGVVPDLTFILDVSPKIGMKRASVDGRDRFERESIEFHTMVRKAFLNIGKRSPKRVKIIDSNKDLATVGDEIMHIADQILKKV